MSAQANAASRQGMLFGDPLEGLDTDEMGYRGPVACSAAGITYRQLDYWARTGLLQPSIRAARGSGSQRLYSFRDILVLKVVKKLLDAGVSLQAQGGEVAPQLLFPGRVGDQLGGQLRRRISQDMGQLGVLAAHRPPALLEPGLVLAAG